MKRIIVCILLVAALQFVDPAASISAQFAGSSYTARIYVVDWQGRPISNAEARVSEGDASFSGIDFLRSDLSGLISIRRERRVERPLVIEVSAEGYQPQRCMIDGRWMNAVTVVLGNAHSSPRREGTKVSATELGAANREAVARLNREGIAAFTGSRYQEAEAKFLEAIRLAPATLTSYNNLGVTLMRIGEFERASVWFEKAFLLSPHDPLAMGNLGLLRWIQGRHAESRQLLDRAVASGFENPRAHYALGILALENGNLLQAERELSLADSGHYPYGNLFRSIACMRLGRSREAGKRLASFRKKYRVPLMMASMR